MNKSILVLAAFAAILGVSAAEPVANEEVCTLHAAKAESIVVDGALDEPVWQNAEWSRPFIPGNSEAKFRETAATVAVAFDDNAAYFALRGPYPADAKPKPYKGDVLADVFAMLISPAEGVIYEVWLRPEGRIMACRYLGAVKKGDQKWRMSKMVGVAKAEPEKHFFSAELRIPFSEFDVAVKGRGEEWRANFMRVGAGSGGWSEWVGLSKQRMVYDAAKFGWVVFGKK